MIFLKQGIQSINVKFIYIVLLKFFLEMFIYHLIFIHFSNVSLHFIFLILLRCMI